jgi:molybdenum cofactor cytidylyltransferase
MNTGTNTDDPCTLAVILAAGDGSRFLGPTHKLMARIGDETVAEVAIRHAREADIGPVLVITGAVDLGADIAHDVTVVHNTNWADGQATSLQVAVAEAERRGCTAIVVGLADQPDIEPEAWRRVAASASPIAVATYGDRRRNPVRLAASVWPLLPATGDEGARVVIRVRPELTEPIPCPGSPADIDTLEDLQSWQNRSSTNSP